jgi:CRISPR-associated endonuclease Cas1
MATSDPTQQHLIVEQTFSRDATDTGICVADGYGLHINVDRSHLVVNDGIGRHRRTRRYARATHELRRLVILGHTGQVTLEALAWCRRLDIAVVILDTDATIQFASVPSSTDDARLRRAQAAAHTTDPGLLIARELLASKLTGQANLLRARFGATNAADTVDELGDALTDASTIDQARQLEAAAAALYWNTWVDRDDTVPRFSVGDAKRVPEHFRVFEGRRSVLASSNSNRKAERPTNALINYLTALAEIEATIACHIVGLDSGLGFVHLDTRGRQSLALDLLEPIRPAIEAFVLDLLADRTFDMRRDFREVDDGHVRLLAPLTHQLAETMPRWAGLVGVHAEQVANFLGDHLDGKYIARTRLTGSKQRAAQAIVKARKGQATSPPARRQRPTVTAETLPFTTCVSCGAPVERKRHLRCPSCWAKQPGQDEQTRRKRGRAIAASRAELERWKSEHPTARTDPEAFRREILPGLQGVKLTDIMSATGMAKSSASMTRSGARVPAVKHWGALARLADTHETRSQCSGASRT